MARKAGKVVQVVTYGITGDTAEVRVLQRPLRFRVEVGDEHFESSNGEQAATWALGALKRHAVTEWQPVIEVFIPTTPEIQWCDGATWYGETQGLVLGCRRFYLGRTPTAWRAVAWERFNPDNPADMADAIQPLRFKNDESYRFIDDPITVDTFAGTLPHRTRGVDDNSFRWEEDDRERARMLRKAARGVLTAYDEATWNALLEVVDTLRRARERVNELIEHPETLAGLGAGNSVLALA